MKTIRLVNESGNEIYDVEVPGDSYPHPGSYIFNGTDVWTVVRQDTYTKESGKPGVEYVVI